MKTLNNIKDFNKKLNRKNHRPMLLDFHTDSCDPCVTLLPTLRKLSKEYSGKVEINKVDIEINKELAERFRIKKVPSLLFIKNREIIKKINKTPTEVELRNNLELLTNNS